MNGAYEVKVCLSEDAQQVWHAVLSLKFMDAANYDKVWFAYSNSRNRVDALMDVIVHTDKDPRGSSFFDPAEWKFLSATCVQTAALVSTDWIEVTGTWTSATFLTYNLNGPVGSKGDPLTWIMNYSHGVPVGTSATAPSQAPYQLPPDDDECEGTEPEAKEPPNLLDLIPF